MSSHLNRIAAGVLAALTAVAVIDVSRLAADEFDEGDVIATTCGAGTLKECGKAPIENCDLDMSFSFNPTSSSFGVSFKMINCKITGYVPIYKDNERGSYVLSPSCNLLAPFLGMPVGSGCS